MENNIAAEAVNTTEPIKETSIKDNQIQPKSNSFLVTLLSFLLLLACIVAAFFAYQTQSLVKELTELKNVVVTPIATNSSVVDPTANWKTYSNILGFYSVKYPSTWEVNNYGLMNVDAADRNTKLVRFSITKEDKSDIGFNIEVSPVVNISKDIEFNETRTIGSVNSVCGSTEDGMNTFCWLKIPSQSNFLIFTFSNYRNIDDSALVNQILSTFKFIAPDLIYSDNNKLEIEIAAKNAFVKKIGQEPTTKYGLSDESLKIVDNWAFGVITTAPLGEGSGPGANYFIARKMDNIWEARMEYTNEFKEWLKISPDGLVSNELKQFLQ